MCFTFSKKTVKKIAIKDIKCYKILLKPISKSDINYTSYYSSYFYRKDKVNPTLILKSERNNYTKEKQINIGYHSYKSYYTAFCKYMNLSADNIDIITFIIPKGSEYYENKKEYVSNNIRIK